MARFKSKFGMVAVVVVFLLCLVALWQVSISSWGGVLPGQIKKEIAENHVKPQPEVQQTQRLNPLTSSSTKLSNQNSDTDQTLFGRIEETQGKQNTGESQPASASVKRTLHPDVKVVPSTPAPDLVLPYKDCVFLPNSPRAGVVICLHPVSDDKYVSGALKKYPDLQLVDFGSNIGEYTLWAAAMGRHVLAVEMLQSNIHLLQTSLSTSNLSSMVTLVNNALYRDHRKLGTNIIAGNMGGSRLNDSSMNDPYASVDKQKASETVSTVCIDDLIPLLKSKSVYMKIDIENSEHHALACAHKFFTEVDVKFVQMEWLNRGLEEVTQIGEFMAKYGYKPSSTVLTVIPVDINTSTIIGHDVFFVKTSTS